MDLELEKTFTDERGIIDVYKPLDFKSFLTIKSKKGAVRANHWHKKDYHLCYIVRGGMAYYERPVGSSEVPSTILVNEGEFVFTGPNVEHAMEFVEDSFMLVFAGLSREQGDYEDDTVRLETSLLAHPDFPVSEEVEVTTESPALA